MLGDKYRNTEYKTSCRYFTISLVFSIRISIAPNIRDTVTDNGKGETIFLETLIHVSPAYRVCNLHQYSTKGWFPPKGNLVLDGWWNIDIMLAMD
jgi:hypothetical protein